VAYAHGGNVTVSSQCGGGSEFELTLPSLIGVGLALPAGPDGGEPAVGVDQDLDEDLDQEQQGSARP
jgi:hypothetical protein